MAGIEIQVAENVKNAQGKFALRKESWSAAVALIAWVCTLVAEHADQIPAAAGSIGQGVALVASLAAFVIARFTVPAITAGQIRQLKAATAHVGDPATGPGESVGAGLPVFDGPSTADAPVESHPLEFPAVDKEG